MAGQIIGYVRVSSTDQDPARQLAAIGQVEETFTDHVSGGSRATRTALASMLRHVREGDCVAPRPQPCRSGARAAGDPADA